MLVHIQAILLFSVEKHRFSTENPKDKFSFTLGVIILHFSKKFFYHSGA